MLIVAFDLLTLFYLLDVCLSTSVLFEVKWYRYVLGSLFCCPLQSSLQDVWRWAAGLSAILRMVAVVANDECLKLQVQEPTWTPPTLSMREITLKSQPFQSDNQIVVSSL